MIAPDRPQFLNDWLPLQPFYQALPYTNIVPCKCPLDPRFQKYMDKPDQMLQLPDLIHQVHKKGFSPVKYILDLNRGANYYYPLDVLGSTSVVQHFRQNIQDRADVESQPFGAKWPSFPDISHIKIALPRTSVKNPGSLQDAQVFQQEIEKVLQFDDQIYDQDPDTLISDLEKINAKSHFSYYVLVHCVHGSNRTGFALSFFLAKKFGFPVGDAIRIFEAARGEPIKRSAVKDNLKENYVDSVSSSTLATDSSSQ